MQTVLVALCFWWLSRDVDWSLALEYCTGVNPAMLAVVFVQRFAPYGMLGLRLTALFSGRINVGTGVTASVLCVGCNTVLPARLGEVVKIVWLRASGGLSYAMVCGGVFLERLLDVSMLLLLALLFALPYVNASLVLVLGLGIVVLWLALLNLASPGSLGRRWIAAVPLPPWLRVWLHHLCTALQGFVNGKIFSRAVAGTVLVWSMNYLHVVLLANGLMHLQLVWQELGLVCVTLFFSSALLLAPGGVGVMEAGVVMVLTLLGVDKSLAVGTALFARVFYSVPPLLGALSIVACGRGTIAANVAELVKDFRSISKQRSSGNEQAR